MRPDLYRARPHDVRHAGLLVVADDALTAGLRRVCDAFAADGYDVLCVGASEALRAAAEPLGRPLLVIGFGEGASAAWEAELPDASAMSLFYPQDVLSGPMTCPTIIHIPRVQAAAWPDAETPVVFPYAADGGFYLDDDTAYDAAAARLAGLRTLALFRRTLSRGEA